mmetsp:Transcript_27834/g.66953  ORF Transcript_27834/g.66953 Transcript_27834/m.66953 type:complete len:271 (-) Transcript_27834:1536-2348(-)
MQAPQTFPTCSVDSTPGPDCRITLATPAACDTLAPSDSSSLPKPTSTTFRNSVTNKDRSCMAPALRAMLHILAHVAKANCLICSSSSKSKTFRNDCTVVPMYSANPVDIWSTKVCKHSAAFFISSISEVFSPYSFTEEALFASPVTMRVRVMSSETPAVDSSCTGVIDNLSRMKGRKAGTKGLKSSFSVMQMRSAADRAYSLTGSSALAEDCTAATSAATIAAASGAKTRRPTAAAMTEMHSTVLPSKTRSSGFVAVDNTCLSIAITASK